MDKRERARLFRERLDGALSAARLSRSDLADLAGVDRSTVSQLLVSPEPRLPNGHIVGEIASALKVSSDWLLGLAARAESAAEILEGSLQIAGAARSPVDENLLAWYREAAGYKIRHVPATLPDLMKTEAVLRFEYDAYTAKTSEQAIADTRGKLAFLRLPEVDIEISMPVQRLAAFARGQGVWEALPAAQRREQLARMAELVREFYPALRLHLFDVRTRYSAPYTVFGPLRAAIYIGQSYFVFSSSKHIRALARHFDGLVRGATVEAAQAAEAIDEMAGVGAA